MKLLIDTHVVIWSLYASENLPSHVKELMGNNPCCVSIASLWEMAIKSSLGKLELDDSIEEVGNYCIAHNIDILPITTAECDVMRKLPMIHKDPFDRILIAQAISKDCTIITKDGIIPRYDVRTIWE